jgi:rhodanese-related sulfurtransferase
MSSKSEERKMKAEQLMITCTNQFPKCATISTLDLVNIMEQKSTHLDEISSLILVDVRSKEERDISMIPGAIAVEEFEVLMKSNPDELKSQLIIPYCTIGYRSGKYGTQLIEKYGFTNVRNGEGIVLWTYQGAGLVTKKDDSVVSSTEVHTFSSAWNLAADGYSTVQFGVLAFAYQGLLALV